MEVEIISDDYKALNLHLNKFPDDWDARLVLSDMLEEVGELELARFQRVLVRYQKRPCPPGDQGWKGSHPSLSKNDWSWWMAGDEDVPSVIGTPLEDTKVLMPFSFPDRATAEAALFRAFDSVGKLEDHLRKVCKFQNRGKEG